MLEILLAVKDYLNDRNIPTRAFKHEVDIEDELEWLVYDNDFMSDPYKISLIAQFGKYSVMIDFDPDEQLLLMADKTKAGPRSKDKRFIKAARFDPHNAEFLQKIYEFIISKH